MKGVHPEKKSSSRFVVGSYFIVAFSTE